MGRQTVNAFEVHFLEFTGEAALLRFGQFAPEADCVELIMSLERYFQRLSIFHYDLL